MSPRALPRSAAEFRARNGLSIVSAWFPGARGSASGRAHAPARYRGITCGILDVLVRGSRPRCRLGHA